MFFKANVRQNCVISLKTLKNLSRKKISTFLFSDKKRCSKFETLFTFQNLIRKQIKNYFNFDVTISSNIQILENSRVNDK